MSFARRKFEKVGSDAHMLGSLLEFNANSPDEPKRHYRFWFTVVGVVIVSTSIAMAHGFLSRDRWHAPADTRPPAAVSKTASAATNVLATVRTERRTPAPVPRTPPLTPAARQAQRWLMQAETRPPADRTLLERLATSEREHRYRMAADSIEKLRARASMADIDDALARRLGALNMQFLFSNEPMPGVTETAVRRGDTILRIAREHGTTTAAVRRLNRLGDSEAPAAGRRLRVLEFPRAVLVIHRSARFADLMLNGRFFQRYYLGAVQTKPGSYPITRTADGGPRTRIAALGIPMAPADLEDVEMFLAPGATISITEF